MRIYTRDIVSNKRGIAMATDHVSLEEFLKDQSTPRFTATIEAVEGKPDVVKVTPWAAASGQCFCHLAINVRKSAFKLVTLTGDTHVCCGKTLKVVELHFKKGETISAEELFTQLRGSAHDERQQVFSNPMPGRPFEDYGLRASAPYRLGQGGFAPHPPWNCEALGRCADKCGDSIWCDGCAFFRLVCTPFGAWEPQRLGRGF
jgi:hypothetical protein